MFTMSEEQQIKLKTKQNMQTKYTCNHMLNLYETHSLSKKRSTNLSLHKYHN